MNKMSIIAAMASRPPRNVRVGQEKCDWHITTPAKSIVEALHCHPTRLRFIIPIVRNARMPHFRQEGYLHPSMPPVPAYPRRLQYQPPS
jgi:hypothetical protein